MTNPALTSMLHTLRRITEATEDRRQTDRQLLERFLIDKDEKVFAILIRRHGRLVLSACRRVLSDEADVEDAFQATFLVLLRKASSVRWQESIGNWLFGIAHRIAVQARANALRRQRREAEASRERRECAAPADLSWREAIGLLHEELDRLPDVYRLPLLMCTLDDKTREEAGKTLGCPVNSIKWRLERGRELLRTRLIRRGVTLSGALLAALVAAPSTTSAAPSLVRATLHAARTGAVHRSLAVLLQSAAPALLKSKVRIALGLLLTIGLLAAAGSRALLPPSAEQPSAARAEPPKQKPDAEAIVVTGRVLDPSGKPVKGARLYAQKSGKDDAPLVSCGVSDGNGRFRVELPRADAGPPWSRSLVAVADGYGANWVDLSQDNRPDELTLRLIEDRAIRGRILNNKGKPVAGVRVRVASLQTTPENRLDDFLTHWQRPWLNGPPRASKVLTAPLERVLPPVVTDKDGRFRIAGVGVERVAILQVGGADIGQDTLYILNRAGFDPAAANKAAYDNTDVPSGNRPPPLLYGHSFDYVAVPTRFIEGLVREAESGKPVAGFTISASGSYGDPITAVSDEQGRYRLSGLPKMKWHLLTALPPKNSSWLRANAYVADAATEKAQPLKVNLTVARGIVVKGRVLDKTTGKGVRSDIRFVPLPGNKFIDKSGYDSASYERAKIETDAEGRFRLTVLPGPVLLMAEAHAVELADGRQIMPYKQADIDAKDNEQVKVMGTRDGLRFFRSVKNHSDEMLNEQNAVKYLDLAADAATVKYDLFVERGQTRTVKVEDLDGKPLTGSTVAGVTDGWPIWSSVFTFSASESSFTAYALDPKRPRRLVLLHPKRQLAGTLTVRGDEKEPPVARLVRTGSVTGRILDMEGWPIADADIELSFSDLTTRKLYAKLEPQRPPIRTGKDGRFRIDGVVPEMAFGLNIGHGRKRLIDPRIGLMQVEAGQTRNLGDIRAKPR